MPNRPRDVLIPVANPDRAAQYIDVGSRIARKLESELVLLSIELEEPDDPQSICEEVKGDPPPALQEARDYAEPFDVPVQLMMLKAQDVAEGIVFAAQKAHIDYLIMGWRGDEEGGETVIGQSIDGLVREANAHTIIMQQAPLKENEHVLIPALTPTLAPHALAVASLLAEGEDTQITVLHLSPGKLGEEDQDAFRDALFSFDEAKKDGPTALIGDRSAFEVVFEVTDEPRRALLDRSSSYDHIVLEATQGQALTEKVLGEHSTHFSEEVTCPLVLVRPKHLGIKFGL